MKKVKILMMLLLLIGGISFAAGGRSNRKTREKRGVVKTRNTDAEGRKYCGQDESGHWYECNNNPGGEDIMPQ